MKCKHAWKNCGGKFAFDMRYCSKCNIYEDDQ